MDEVSTIFAEVFEVPAEVVSPATNPEDIEAWDSLGHLALIQAIESRFQITLEMGEMFEIQSAGDVLVILKRHGVLGSDQ